MTLFIVSFIAGILTILAPCILPLLPAILAGSLTETSNRRRPFIIIASLAASVFLFTLILKGSTALIDGSPVFWTYVSGIILVAFALTLLFPETWARLVLLIPGHNKPDSWISRGYGQNSSIWTDIAVGAALGPVFTTCSPTFFVILATVLPQSFAMGVIDLLAYILGLSISLLIVAFIGQKLVNHLEWASDPKGWFKKVLGVLFLALAILIMTGQDKKLEAAILNAGFFDVTSLEQKIHVSLEGKQSYASIPEEESASSTDATGSSTSASSSVTTMPLDHIDASKGNYVDIARPAGFVNSAPFKLADIVGRKVILIDFIDYSCINCERTFPYLNDWYSKYKDQGLEIVAIHTPEFSFEKDIRNVQAAAQQFGLKFPIVLDNDYATWNAYGNQYWPHKYLIDIHGNVVYDHIGEGSDDEIEAMIVKALNARKVALHETGKVVIGKQMAGYTVQTQSPETYFGALRNEYFGNGTPEYMGPRSFSLPATLTANKFYLDGTWDVQEQYIHSKSAPATIAYQFSASNMYVIAVSPEGKALHAKILVDGKPITAAQSGADVKDGVLTVTGSRLYHIFHDTTMSTHRIDLIWQESGVELYTFTFG